MNGTDIVARFDALDSQRKTLDRVLQDIEEYVVPYRGEFYRPMTSEHEVDVQRKSIYDNTAGISVNLLASQVHGNVTSPVVKWFGLRFRDEDLNTDVAAKEWLEDSEEKVWQTIQESNFDTVAPEVYLDQGSFGTAMLTMEDEDDLIWKGVSFNTMPLMDSYFEAGPDGLPYRMYRKLRYTKLEMEDTFELPKTLKVKDKDLDKTSVDQKDEVIFCMYKEPKNTSEEPILAPTLRPVQWRYVHRASKKVLRKKGQRTAAGGYYEFPGMAIRWGVTAGSKWGFSPAMIMISDIKMLNELTAQGIDAISKAVDPPLKALEQGIIGDADNVPSGLTIVTDMDAIQPLYQGAEFTNGIQVGFNKEDRLQQSIRAGFFVDKLELPDQRQMTATEVQIRYERMLRLLAPMLGRLKADFLMPVVTGIFNKLMRAGQLDEMPEVLEDAEMDVEFTGPLPRAMKGEVADGMERWLLGMVQQIEINPEGMDIVDFDQYNRTMAEQRGVPAKVTNTREEVKDTRQKRADAQAQAQEIETVRAAGEAATAAGEGADAMSQAGANLEVVS